MVYGYAHTVEELAAKGAPLGWLPIQPVFMNLVGVGLTAKAPHPNAAQLFIEFLTSREGQMVISSFHRVPARPDVPTDPPRLTQGLKFFTLDPEIAEHYEEYEGLFLRTFSTAR
jgi:iron(III) transport system substrate-binding protein